MKALFILSVSLICLMVTGCEKEDISDPTPDSLQIGKVGDTLLKPNLEKVLQDYNIPALAAMSMGQNGVLEQAAIGTLSTISETKVSSANQWHIGSLTKSMTATLIGILVENGYMEWTTTIGDLTTEGYLEDYRNVNFIQLLSHTSGIIADDYPVDPNDNRPVSEIRQEWALAVLNEPRGSGFAYSNNGYVVAGVMLELIMQTSWEDLMVTYLLEPLNMEHTYFGAPGKDGSLQPWGHQSDTGGWEPMDPMDQYSDNPEALGPAGTVHTTLADLSKYIELHMGKNSLVTPTTLDMLHKEVDNSGYALGWNVNQNGIFHSGSNARWFAQLFISSDRTFSSFAVTNSYDSQGEKSIPAVLGAMEIVGKRFSNNL